MLFQPSGECLQGAGFASSWRLAANLSRPRAQCSLKLLIHTAECLLLIIGRLVRRAMQPSDYAWPPAPRSLTSNIQYEILRIEARRRI